MLWVYSDAGGECLMDGVSLVQRGLGCQEERGRGNRFLSFWVDLLYLPT
jgi:hypothetical protein